YNARKWVNADTGDEIVDRAAAKTKGIKVITKCAFIKRRRQKSIAPLQSTNSTNAMEVLRNPQSPIQSSPGIKRQQPSSAVTGFVAEKRSLEERSSSTMSLSTVKSEEEEVTQPVL